MTSVLFICLGNICRSPMAEAVFRKLVKDEGLETKIQVDSAGTASWHIGKSPHEGTITKLAEYNISTEGQVCRQLQKEDYETFDYLVAMDGSNMKNMYTMIGIQDDEKVIRLLDLTSHKKDLPDPYHTGDFQETYDLVLEGCKELLKKMKSDNALLL